MEVKPAPPPDAVDVDESDAPAVDVWCVIIPDEVYRYGRPLSQVWADLRVQAQEQLSPR